MRLYSGITDNDQPKNGGAFVKENNDACESFNFYPYNHYCLGYTHWAIMALTSSGLDLATLFLNTVSPQRP